jgi:ADP-ribosylglycohydrolase
MTMQRITNPSAYVGCLIGTAVGDAMGLPFEGLSRARVYKWLRHPGRYAFLAGGRGMLSDDTEHACMVAQSLIEAAGDEPIFTQHLARRLRLWLLALPAGTGLATLRACLKLLFGWPPTRSGVFSAGNGPAMRSPIIGVAAGHDRDQLRALVRASTRITHTDPKAEYGALAVALAAYMAARSGGNVDAQRYSDELEALLGKNVDAEFLTLINRVIESVRKQESTLAFAAVLGLERGVTGYIYHTVPVALHAWLRDQDDIRSAIMSVIRCGGDTDSTAAVVGGIVGAGVGLSRIPVQWRENLVDRPRTVAWMSASGKQLAEVVTTSRPMPALRLSPILIVLRNLFFLLVVLAHGVRRLFPPY